MMDCKLYKRALIDCANYSTGAHQYPTEHAISGAYSMGMWSIYDDITNPSGKTIYVGGSTPAAASVYGNVNTTTDGVADGINFGDKTS